MVNVGGGEYRKLCKLGVNVWVVNVGQSYIVFTFEGQMRSSEWKIKSSPVEYLAAD